MADAVVRNWASKAEGEIGEGLMRKFFTSTGWEEFKIPSKNPINGVDGCFIKRNTLGTVSDVALVESKVNAAKLGQLKTEFGGIKQGSPAYYERQISKALEIPSLSQPEIKTLNQINEHLLRGSPRLIIQRTSVDGSYIKITHEYVDAVSGANEVNIKSSRIVADFDYARPKNSFEKMLAKNFDESFGEFLEKKGVKQGLSLEKISKIKGETLAKIRAGGEPYSAIRSAFSNFPSNDPLQINSQLQKPLNSVWERTQVGSRLTKINGSSRNFVDYSKNVSKNVFNSSPLKAGAAAGGIVFAIDSSAAVYKYVSGEINAEDLKEAMSSTVERSLVAGTSTIPVTAVTGAILPDGSILCATNAGFFVISIEMGLASYELFSGNIDVREFVSLAEKSIIKGAAVGGATYVSVLLGAAPGGLVVLAVGTGAYVITDLAISEFERRKWVYQSSLEELRSWGICIDSMYEKKNPTSPFNRVNPTGSFRNINSNSSFLPNNIKTRSTFKNL